MSFVRLEYCPTGEVLFDGPEPETRTGTIEEVTDVLLDQIYSGDLRRSRSKGHIPAGCGDYRTETRRFPEQNPGSCWEALDFYVVI